jgi:hypothetical protein
MKNRAILAWIAGTRKIGSRFDRDPFGRIRATPPYAANTRRGKQPLESSDVLVLTRHRGIHAVRSSRRASGRARVVIFAASRRDGLHADRAQPCRGYLRSSAHVTIVLPTPVSVPVMNVPPVIAWLAVRRG